MIRRNPTQEEMNSVTIDFEDTLFELKDRELATAAADVADAWILAHQMLEEFAPAADDMLKLAVAKAFLERAAWLRKAQ